MKTGKCKNCKYWIGYECEKANWVEDYEQPEKASFAFYADALDDTDLTGGVVTGPEFGCVLFEYKDK